MVLGSDRLQALRDCCRDEAAFIRLQSLLSPEDLGAVDKAMRSPSPQSHLLQGVAEAISHLLTSKDYTQAMNAAIATVGRITGVDRAYLFSVHPHPETGEPLASQKFEWVRESISAQIDNPVLQNWSYHANGMGVWHEMLQSGQVIRGSLSQVSAAERALMEPQHIQSILIVPILVDGELQGFIGFDDCHSERQWTEDEQTVLMMMATSIGGAIARQQAQEALQQSETKLRKIAANVPGMIFQMLRSADCSKHLLYVSSGSQDLLELDLETIQDDDFCLVQLCHPDDRAAFEQSIEQSASTLQSWNWEGRIITPSSQVKWVEIFSRPEPQTNGDLLWDGVMVDITERKQAEEECRQSEAHYRAMLDASPDLIFRVNRQGIYLDCKGNSTVGVMPDQIIGRSMHDILPADVADLCFNAIQETLDRQALSSIEYQMTTPQGLRDYEARLAASGEDEVLAVVRDVTERKQAEADLRNSEDRLQSFFEATFEAVIIHDYGTILDVNPAAETLFGYSASELIGMPVLDLPAPSTREKIVHRWQTLQSPDVSYEYEGEGVRKDGSTFIGAVYAKVTEYKGKKVRVAGIRDITARKQAEAAILQSEARNRALVNAIPDLMFRISRDGTYLDCKVENDYDVLLPPQQLLGKTVYEVLPPDLAEQRMHYVRQALETGEIQHFEYQLEFSKSRRAAALYSNLSPDLSKLPVEDCQQLRDYEARIVVSGDDEVLAIVRDITERKLSEEALRLSEEKFAKAFRASPTPKTITTLHSGRIIEVNESFLDLIQLTREQVVGHTVHELNLWVNPSDREQIVQPLQQKGSVRNLELRFRMPSGEIRVGLFSAELIHINGEPCMLDVTVDITERKWVEEQLRMTAERDRILSEIALRIRQSLDLSQILKTTVAEVRQFLKADRVYIAHTNEVGQGMVVAESVAPQWRSMLGYMIYSRDRIQDLTVLFQPNQVRVVNDTHDVDDVAGIADFYTEYQIRAGLAVLLIVGDEIFGILGVNQCTAPRQWKPFEIGLLDRLANQVTIAIQQGQLYQQVQELNAGLEQQVEERTAQLWQKMQELQDLNELKDEFLNAFSHDLRTPVMGLSLVLNNLLNQSGEAISITRAVVERMLQSSNHQLNLINSLLEAHSSERRGVILNYELVQLSLLVQVIAEDLEPLVAKNEATLVNQVPDDLPLVTADPVQLRRVFENLITNALHHNPPGITLTLNATVEAEMIRFTFKDTGVGISPEVCDRLFKRYVRGPQSRHSAGVGLGLYLCYQIITAHGGQIGVNSVFHQGATFWLTLPLAIPSTPSLPIEPELE